MTIMLIVLGSIVFLVILARTFFFLVDVQGKSMQPTLQHGDKMLALRFFPARWLRKEQIVVLRFRAEEDLGIRSQYAQLYIKRLVGLPNETVSFPVYELPPHLQERKIEEQNSQAWRVWHIPPGHGFFKGDSLGLDSTIVGPVPLKNVRGVILLKLYSPSRLQKPDQGSEWKSGLL